MDSTQNELGVLVPLGGIGSVILSVFNLITFSSYYKDTYDSIYTIAIVNRQSKRTYKLYFEREREMY